MTRPNEPWDNSNGDELLPPEDHTDLARQVFVILEQVIKDKSKLGLPEKWLRFYEMGKNKHWRGAAENLNLVSANLLHAHRTRTVNLLTDNNPTFNVKRVQITDDSEDQFDKLLRTSEFWWNETEQQDILEVSVQDAETYGSCVEKVIFNNKLEYGLGEAETVNVDVHNFGVYPVKAKCVQKAEAVLHYYPLSVREAKRKWKDFKDQIKPDGKYLNEFNQERREVNSTTEAGLGGSTGSTNYGGTIRNLMNYIGSQMNKDNDEVVVCEIWVKDYTEEEFIEKRPVDPNDPRGAYENVKKTKPKYKGNIRVVTAINGMVVVSDKSNPSINHNLPEEKARMTYLYDRFPFSWTPSIKDTSNAWGMSDFEQLIWLQKEINKSISQFTTIKDRIAGMKIINPKTSGVHNNALGNGVGVLNPSGQQHGIEWLKPPPIPKEILDALKQFQELFYLVSGTFDLEAAQSPGKQVIAYKAIAALIERAATMLRGKIRNYGKMIRERGRMYTSHVQNWYTEERFISYESDGEELTDSVKGEDVIVPMRLTVVSGSTMPRSQVQMREEAIELHAKGAIDAEELLKKLDWPDYKKVIARMNAGPLQSAALKWEMAGVPPELTQYMTEVGTMDDKKVARALERAEMPTFPDQFEVVGMTDADPDKELERERKRVEIDEILKRMEKIDAEIGDLAADQKLERDKLRHERAQLAKDIRDKKKESTDASV